MPKSGNYPDSESARYEILSDKKAVDILGASIDISTRRFRGGHYAQKEDVAEHFGIDLPMLDDYIAKHGAELAKSGYEVLRGKELARYLSTAGAENVKVTPSQLCVFERKAIVNLALLIREGKIAAHFRDEIPNTLSRGTAPRRKPESLPSPAQGIPDRAITRAISIRQPYVELILQGAKTEEYRSMPTNIRERVYLYASLRLEGYLKALNQPQPRFWLPRFA
ncbi:MAG: hypothetical protein M0001_04305 [Treponema sp.]|nr:hypothetical protein [Treponema sp.]